MNIEIIEFYPNKDKAKKGIGTLHAYLPDLEIDIRGIFVKVKGKHWFFGVPHKHSEEKEIKGKKMSYPIFSFTSIEKNKEFRKSLAEKGKEFILKNKLYIEPQKRELPNDDGRIRARNTSRFQNNK